MTLEEDQLNRESEDRLLQALRQDLQAKNETVAPEDLKREGWSDTLISRFMESKPSNSHELVRSDL